MKQIDETEEQRNVYSKSERDVSAVAVAELDRPSYTPLRRRPSTCRHLRGMEWKVGSVITCTVMADSLEH